MTVTSGSSLRVKVEDDAGASLTGATVTGTLTTLAGAELATFTDGDFARADDNLSATAETDPLDFRGTAELTTSIEWPDQSKTVKRKYVSFE